MFRMSKVFPQYVCEGVFSGSIIRKMLFHIPGTRMASLQNVYEHGKSVCSAVKMICHNVGSGNSSL